MNKSSFNPQLMGAGNNFPLLRIFFGQRVPVNTLAQALAVDMDTACLLLRHPRHIRHNHCVVLDDYFQFAKGTLARMVTSQIRHDNAMVLLRRPVSHLIPYRDMIIRNGTRPLREVFGRQVPLAVFAQLLRISIERASYLLRHADQITPSELVALDRAFAVREDTFWEMAVSQWRQDRQRYRPAPAFYRHWCLRKRRLRHH